MSSSRSDLLSFSEIGQGVPVVFLHPTPLDREYWRPLVTQLEGVHAILPDLRGHGRSALGTSLAVGGFAAVPDAPVLSMRQLAVDVLDLLDHLHVEQAVFAGCSIGGYVLLELWRQMPERIKGLAFVCSKPQPDAPANAARRAATIDEARAGNRAKIFDAMVQSLTGATARARRSAMVTELRRQMDAVTAETLVAVQAGLATRPDSVPDVPTIRVPVLAIAGGEDQGVTVEEMRVFEQAPGGCNLHLLEDAGHFAAYEQPERVAALLQAWLERFKA